MILNTIEWQAFENHYVKTSKTSVSDNFKLFDALYEEACALGVLPSKKPLENIKFKIKFAKALNSV